MFSDRFGRKPVLAVSQVGSALGYLMLGLATHYSDRPELMLLIVYGSRIIDGFTGGNISTVQAYIADVTTPDKRAKWMGMLGAAFGVGFVLGPTIGGVLGSFNPSYPAYLAMIMAGSAAVVTWVRLPESRPASGRVAPAEAEVWLHPGRFVPILKHPILSQLLAISFFTMAAFVMMESTMAVFLSRHYGWAPLHIGLFFGYIGVVIVFVQGRLLGKLTRRRGEWALSAAGPLIVAVGMVCYCGAGLIRPGGVEATTSVFVISSLLLLLGGAANATGRSVQQPTITSLISRYSGKDEQGVAFGLFHGLGSLARVAGPLLAAPLFGLFHNTGQFVAAAILTAAMSVWTARLRGVASQTAPAAEAIDQPLAVPVTSGKAHAITTEPA